jgi:hypothetical protein
MSYGSEDYEVIDYEQWAETRDANASRRGDQTQIENHIVWNDIDWNPLIMRGLGGLAMMAPQGPENNDAHNAGSAPSRTSLAEQLQTLPNEVLLEIIQHMSTPDKILAALALPDVFMNDIHINLFTADAERQLDYPSHIAVPPAIERQRWPLLLEAIAVSQVDAADIARILDEYDRVCRERNVAADVFLNSNFPANQPADVQPPLPSPSPRREVLTPLHVAIRSERRDIVNLLIGCGARVNRMAAIYNKNNDMVAREEPFRYAARLGTFADDFFSSDTETRDERRARLRRLEDMALDLAPFNAFGAYTGVGRIRTVMRNAVANGWERVCLLLLNRNKKRQSTHPIEPVDLWIAQQEVLRLALADFNRVEMPNLVVFLLENGARYNDTVFNGVVARGLAIGHVDTAEAALRWQIRVQDANIHHSYSSIGAYARQDEAEFRILRVDGIEWFDLTKRFANVMIELHDERGLASLFWNALMGRDRALNTRQWLLNNAPAAINGVTLRHAIGHRDRTTVAFMLQWFRSRGQSIDEPLNGDAYNPSRRQPPPPNFYGTPLNYALAQENYYEAVHLLFLGADPTRVAPEIRHQVNAVRQELVTKNWSFLPRFRMFRTPSGLADGEGKAYMDKDANDACDYVFMRMLDDPACPLPAYSGPIHVLGDENGWDR